MISCNRCKKDKIASEMKSGKICLICADKLRKYYLRNNEIIKKKAKKYKENNSEIIKKKAKIHYSKNKPKMLKAQKQYYINNIEGRKQYNEKYYEKNKDKILIKVMEYTKARKKIDPIFKLRKRISADIWRMLKLNGASKNGSILKHLPYTLKELKDHIESQFEPWMTWANWGTYNKNTWNDNDQTTWKWQVDHIISHSTFKYSSMEEQSFKDCWLLSNLRPYSAKQNIIKNKY